MVKVGVGAAMVLKVLNSRVRLNKTVNLYIAISYYNHSCISLSWPFHISYHIISCSGNEGADLTGSDPALHISDFLLVPPHQQPRLAISTEA